jgi:glycerol-3-phosphate acyltransferase PlsX
MGGDNAPNATLKGACLAHKMLEKNERLVLVGDKNLAHNWFSENNIDSSIFDFINAEESIEMNEHATKALRKKPNNSISVGFNALKKQRN